MHKALLTASLLLTGKVAVAETPQTQEAMSAEWKKIEITDVKNPVTLFHKDWMALAAGNKDAMNAMTIGWGSIGELWQKPVVTVYVAPERHTNGFLEKSDYFTVTAFPESKREALTYIGSHSGRDGDKLKVAGLTPEFTTLGNPVFKEGSLTIECKIIYKDTFKPEFMKGAPVEFYKNRKLSPHVIYVGEVVNVWEKKK